MEEFTIYYGTPQGKDKKIGVDSSYPRRIIQQKIQDGQVLEVHTDIYEVSRREQELQRQYGVKVDTVPYHIVYFMTQDPIRNAKISATGTGRTHSDEVKAFISALNKGNTNGSGNKGKTTSKETKAKISESLVGITRNTETRSKISKAKKGVPQSKLQCPYCQKIGGSTNMTRYHFDNCKHKQHE